MQTKITLLRLFFTAFLISSCGISRPFVDSRREAGQSYMVGESTLDTVAICYNSLTFTPLELKDMAEKECKKTDRTARFKKQSNFSCRFFAPTRAYFDCVEIGENGEEIHEKKQTIKTFSKTELDENKENDIPLTDKTKEEMEKIKHENSTF